VNKLYNYYYAAKAWWAGVMVAITALVEAVYAALQDDAVSLAEVEGVIMLGMGAIGALAAFKLVWQVRNQGQFENSAPTTLTRGPSNG
jgi:hypothetical protein